MATIGVYACTRTTMRLSLKVTCNRVLLSLFNRNIWKLNVFGRGVLNSAETFLGFWYSNNSNMLNSDIFRSIPIYLYFRIYSYIQTLDCI